MARHSFAGAPALTYLTGSINSTDPVLPVASTAGWPDTSIGEFVIVVDAEKMLCSAYTSTSVTVETRGYDSTPAVGHEPGTTGQVFPCLDATQFDLHDAFVASVGTIAPSTSAVGDSPSPGSSNKPAAADHIHGRESFATVTTPSAPGDTKFDGTSASPAHADHRHAREASQLGLPLALAGATSPTRYVGATTSGAPVSGNFLAGDFVIDLTAKVWVCTIAGSPGTWVDIVAAEKARALAAEALLAPLTGATFTGAVHAPTPLPDDNSTLVATTAYVQANTQYEVYGQGSGIQYGTRTTTILEQFDVVSGLTSGYNFTVAFPKSFPNFVGPILITPTSVPPSSNPTTWSFTIAIVNGSGFILETSVLNQIVGFSYLAKGG